MRLKHVVATILAILVYPAMPEAQAMNDAAIRDVESVHRIYRSATADGDPLNMFRLGALFEHGIGVPQSYEEAINWYRRATERGEAEAMNNLGILYAAGKGVQQDFGEATRWYRMAAERGSVSAMNNIATSYFVGLGVPRSYAEAAQWFQSAATKGDTRAMNSLGVMYDKGLGVKQSRAAAAKLFQQAAAQGYSPAMVNLGDMYEHGEGLKRNYIQAYVWISAALMVGLPEETRDAFAYKLGMIAAHLRQEDVAEAKRLAEQIVAHSAATSTGAKLDGVLKDSPVDEERPGNMTNQWSEDRLRLI